MAPENTDDTDDEWYDADDRNNFELDDDGDDSDGSGGNLIMDGEAQDPFADTDETDDGDD